MVLQEEAVGSVFLIRVHQKNDNLTLQYEICIRHTVKNINKSTRLAFRFALSLWSTAKIVNLKELNYEID